MFWIIEHFHYQSQQGNLARESPYSVHQTSFHQLTPLDAGRKFNVQKTSSECLMYVQFTSRIQGANIILAQVTFLADIVI